jgi:outer membrane protein
VAGAAAREQLEKDKAAMQRQLDGQKTELEKMRDELEKKGQLLSVDARREKQEAMERKVRDVRRLVDDLQAQLQKKEDALLQKVLQDVAGLIQRLGKDRGFAVVPMGAFDDDPGVRPERHIYVDSKASWDEITDGLPTFPGPPPSP